MAATSTSATPLNGAPAAMVDSDMPVTSARSIRVFSLGDHELVWRGLTDLLMVTDDLITQAASAGDALRRIPAAAPDGALLDAMPEAVPRSLETRRGDRASREQDRRNARQQHDWQPAALTAQELQVALAMA